MTRRGNRWSKDTVGSLIEMRKKKKVKTGLYHEVESTSGDQAGVGIEASPMRKGYDVDDSAGRHSLKTRADCESAADVVRHHQM